MYGVFLRKPDFVSHGQMMPNSAYTSKQSLIFDIYIFSSVYKRNMINASIKLFLDSILKPRF